MKQNIVDKVASVAKISLTAAEKNKFEKDIKNILDSFKDLDSATVTGIKPTFQPVEAKTALREDKEESCLTQKESLANTALNEKGFFKGPKAI
ncbi:MAG: Asp-tRNA(Asn)/Glu-tRNA(Gln) amidotransferase subunit GatC [Candidatus Aenigmarchaeota archaeon]|nr:Asp-tRNA(Asn)/Glu-tRNA(Gln) amidotransferase subunit GatC [Candidatus Aenigmarchaeota archaeon]